MIREVSKKFSLTETEVKVILFLLIIFIIGICAKYLFLSEKITEYQEYDYSQEDSLFALLGRQEEGNKKPSNLNSTALIDSEREVLDFNKGNFSQNQKLKFSTQTRININKAGLNDLVKLPGIGEKTAANIIEYRTAHGAFSKLEELLNIHGIGSSKLLKIKEYIVFNEQSDSIKNLR
ncbi:MAG TPA: helix-hairpin-helix domain-containing protein [Ignavibacteriaceae bacterium]|nr:helix-hairpin-helix domain-containing protein [Ignavibacteriaceae bacterium]